MTPSLQPLTALGAEGANLCYMSRPVGTEREAEKDVKTKRVHLCECWYSMYTSYMSVTLTNVAVYWCTSVAAVTCTCAFLVRLLLDLQDQHNTHSPQQYPGTVR